MLAEVDGHHRQSLTCNRRPTAPTSSAAIYTDHGAPMRQKGRAGRWIQAVTVILAGLALYGCATLGTLGMMVRPLRIEAARERPAELRLGGGGLGSGRIGLPDAATLRLWATIENPNPFGL